MDDAPRNTASSYEEETDSDLRQRSTIGFPYADMSDVEAVAAAIHSNVGGGTCDDSQLAPWLSLSAKSSGYRVRVSAARLFNLIESIDGDHRLTELGKMIVDPLRQRAARVEAFLTVPLFNRIYEQHKGGVLPPATALERAIEAAGVAPKQKQRARQILERSAEQAGFFEQGKNRLVKPGIAHAQASQDQGSHAEHKELSGVGNTRGLQGGSGELDPMLQGLVAKLPQNGASWAVEDRVTWLKAATVIFQLVYGTENEIDVFLKGTKLHFGGGQTRSSHSGAAEAHPEGGLD